VSKNPFEWADQTRQFMNEVQVEFKKVTWPKQKDTVAGAVSVVVVSLVVGVILSLADFGLLRVVGLFLP
jgi:preprotein translocase subunit SecE